MKLIRLYGRVLALLGRNGAGKTTCMNAVIGFVPPRDGEIRLFGEPISRLSPEAISHKGIGLVPQGRRVFPTLNVRENLIVARQSRTSANGYWTLARVLELFPSLRERQQQHAGSLSGGEQQMVAIGRGLMTNPKLLLLDEPSLGLAPFMVQQIRKIIVDINASGTAVLLVEQNAQMALSIAHYGYVLETGKIVLAQPAAELLQNESVRKFYLGLHEGSERSNMGTLRQQRSTRRWVL